MYKLITILNEIIFLSNDKNKWIKEFIEKAKQHKKESGGYPPHIDVILIYLKNNKVNLNDNEVIQILYYLANNKLLGPPTLKKIYNKKNKNFDDPDKEYGKEEFENKNFYNKYDVDNYLNSINSNNIYYNKYDLNEIKLIPKITSKQIYNIAKNIELVYFNTNKKIKIWNYYIYDILEHYEINRDDTDGIDIKKLNKLNSKLLYSLYQDLLKFKQKYVKNA